MVNIWCVLRVLFQEKLSLLCFKTLQETLLLPITYSITLAVTVKHIMNPFLVKKKKKMEVKAKFIFQNN